MRIRRSVRIALAAIIAILIGVSAAWHYFSRRLHLEPWQLLAHVVQLENSGTDLNSLQALGWSLTILGRDDEVRAMEFYPRSDQHAPDVEIDETSLQVVPWREGIRRIASEHRIVMIMENHCVSKHREFIGAALPVFHDARFTHYAAEAIGPDDNALSERGYPSSRTGLYTSDPRFGNALRRALDLNFTVLGYDFRPFTPEGREEYAATTLAGVIQRDAGAKLLVHAGHAHVLKYPTTLGERWLASRLWDKTGIEPFTIWQWSTTFDSRDYAAIVRVLKKRGMPFDEPVFLMPPPAMDSGLRDPPYGLAQVDAIVIHPPDESVAPANRTVLFPTEMQQCAGHWKGDQWPVVMSAYKQGEPMDAIPLDQVLLRQGETAFVLWIPKGTEFQIRVFTAKGMINSDVVGRSPDLTVWSSKPTN